MAKYTRSWGPGGMDHDEYGPLPVKRVENMRGIDVASRAPVHPETLREMIKAHVRTTGMIPTRLIYPGTECGCTVMGIVSSDFGYCSVKLVCVPNVEAIRLE